MTKKINFGIMCNGLVFEAWEAACINHLMQHEQIELKLLVIKANEDSPKLSLFQKLIKYPYNHFFYRAYKRYWLKATSYKLISFEEAFNKLPFMNCTTTKEGKYNEYFTEEDIQKIKSHNLDFMLRFGFNIIKGKILESCKYGIWSFHHADNDFIRGGPIGFWEIYLKRHSTAAVLQQLNNQLDQGVILRKGYLKTINHSFVENVDQLTEMASLWPLQACIDLLNNKSVVQYSNAITSKAKLYRYPTNWKFLQFMLILGLNKFKFHVNQMFFSESWQIARYEQDLDDFVKSPNALPAYITPSDRESYYADPFLWPTDNHQAILFEQFSYKDQKGKIGLSDFNGKNIKLLNFGVNAHMSYPFCFSYENQVFCLPEQADLNCVTLYKIASDGEVIKVMDLIENFAARDSSLVFYQQKWWLFCTKANYFENAALFIFSSNSLTEVFIPHSNNPVKVDINNGRPAGPLYVKDNVLFRPAQNSARHYGHKVNLNKITELSDLGFKEEIVHVFEAKQFGNFSGIHHVASRNGQTIIDLKQSKFSFYNFCYQLNRKVRKIF